LASSELRDRDAIVSGEGLIFRVFGYSHPAEAYVCDAEYAPASIFKSVNPRAFRNEGQNVFYKFYDDEGWKFIENAFPQYMVLHQMLQKKTVGVKHGNIKETRKPEKALKRMIETEPKDSLHRAMQNVLDIVVDLSGLSVGDFGVFGSLLHGFHHPQFSDIDLVIYGKEKAAKLRKTLEELYEADSSLLHNEFETDESIKDKTWRFRNFTPKDFLWHQRRKLIYSLFSGESGRIVKTEFEPVKAWREVHNEYDPETRILQQGWVKMLARVKDDSEAPFIPSIYRIEPLKILCGGKKAQQAERVVSYMEEFRMQAFRDETIYVEGNLEEVAGKNDSFSQVTLTYCPRYYEQVLKTTDVENI
jgi:predicted nucleotidyltransferase